MKRWIAIVAVMITWLGCGKKEAETTEDKCIKGELHMSVKFSKDLAAQGVPERDDCPTRLSTTKGSSPPMDAWKDGIEPHWGPELLVQLDKEKSAESRKADDGKCIYTWSKGCN